MKKNIIRTADGGYATMRRANRCVERGVGKIIDGVLHMIQTDHRVSVDRITSAWVPPPYVRERIGDSGQSVYPIIGYHRETNVRLAA